MRKKWNFKCPNTKLIVGTGFFSLCCIIMGTSEAKSLLSKRKKFTYLCSQQEEELLGKISANHQLVCLSALSEPRTHSGDSKGSFVNLYRLSCPAQVPAKANLLCRLTGELLVAPRELSWDPSLCHSLLGISLPLLPRGGWRSSQFKPLNSQHNQSGTTPPVASISPTPQQ